MFKGLQSHRVSSTTSDKKDFKNSRKYHLVDIRNDSEQQRSQSNSDRTFFDTNRSESNECGNEGFFRQENGVNQSIFTSFNIPVIYELYISDNLSARTIADSTSA